MNTEHSTYQQFQQLPLQTLNGQSSLILQREPTGMMAAFGEESSHCHLKDSLEKPTTILKDGLNLVTVLTMALLVQFCFITGQILKDTAITIDLAWVINGINGTSTITGSSLLMKCSVKPVRCRQLRLKLKTQPTAS